MEGHPCFIGRRRREAQALDIDARHSDPAAHDDAHELSQGVWTVAGAADGGPK